MKYFLDIIKANVNGQRKGVYSVCSANELVLEAAFYQAKCDDSIVLIESTANQVNQFGGYTGLTAERFYRYVHEMAQTCEFPAEKIILGGDHLGPVCWTHIESAKAMDNAKTLIGSYVRAGFKKIHLDTSMACVDDPEVLSDEVIAMRAAELAVEAEKVAFENFGGSELVFVIGTEVPPPGGASSHDLGQLQVSKVEDVLRTVGLHEKYFKALGIEDAFRRVIAVVVQPGVEFGNDSVYDYKSSDAKNLREVIDRYKQFVFEAHSTDYQMPQAYHELVCDHFAILKVGPQLTFAMREALFALSYIEDLVIAEKNRSKIRDIGELEMLSNPRYWEKFYDENATQGKILRFYSFSDRIRYYWNSDKLGKSVKLLIDNLSNATIPLPLLSQFLPEQYKAVRAGGIPPQPRQLIKHKISQVLKDYSSACHFCENKLVENCK